MFELFNTAEITKSSQMTSKATLQEENNIKGAVAASKPTVAGDTRVTPHMKMTLKNVVVVDTDIMPAKSFTWSICLVTPPFQ